MRESPAVDPFQPRWYASGDGPDAGWTVSRTTIVLDPENEGQLPWRTTEDWPRRGYYDGRVGLVAESGESAEPVVSSIPHPDESSARLWM